MTQHEESMWERIFSRGNMLKALGRVELNRGAPGVDGMTVKELPDHLKAHWTTIRAKLDACEYEPSPVKRVVIPKPDGGERLLGIPTVQDRLIQQAMHQVLSEEYDPKFSEASYGFRPERSAHDAVRVAREYIESGKAWVVDMDLERFFDTVNHDRLMSRLKQDIEERRVLWLVNQYLKAGVMVNGVVMRTEEGTPQGGPLSPLLSNIVLDELDRELERRGHSFVRYADDCNIYVSSRRAAERVLASTQRYVEEKLRLKVNEKKSAVDLATRRKFLGFSFYYRGTGGVGIRIAPQSLVRMRRKVKKLTRRNQGKGWIEIRDNLRRAVTGWVAYYALADAQRQMEKLDGWMRRRLRQLSWKQWKRPGKRYQRLRELGVSKYWAIRAGGSSKGPWRMSKAPAVERALSNDYWRKVGLVSFSQQYELRRT
jgi:group II intron reverse transcriptase/maturase